MAGLAREHAEAVRAAGRTRARPSSRCSARISDPELFARPIVITNTDFRFVVAEQLRERGIEADIVLEPVRRDSGPAVAVAARARRRARSGCHRAGAGRRSCHSQARGIPRRLPAGGGGRGRRAGSSPSASRPRIRRRTTAISAPARRSTARRCMRSRRSSRSPTPRPRPATWPSTISGTAAISCFMPARCWARSSASSRRWRRPRRRRSRG